MTNEYDHTAKADSGKAQLSLVPRKIIWDIAKVRMYGNKKYKDPDNWRHVEPERYRDAAFRHFLAYLDDPDGTDEESGIKHLHHLACNIAFLCEMEDTPAKTCRDCGEVDYSVAYPTDPPQYKCGKYGCLIKTTDKCKGASK